MNTKIKEKVVLQFVLLLITVLLLMVEGSLLVCAESMPIRKIDNNYYYALLENDILVKGVNVNGEYGLTPRTKAEVVAKDVADFYATANPYPSIYLTFLLNDGTLKKTNKNSESGFDVIDTNVTQILDGNLYLKDGIIYSSDGYHPLKYTYDNIKEIFDEDSRGIIYALDNNDTLFACTEGKKIKICDDVLEYNSASKRILNKNNETLSFDLDVSKGTAQLNILNTESAEGPKDLKKTVLSDSDSYIIYLSSDGKLYKYNEYYISNGKLTKYDTGADGANQELYNGETFKDAYSSFAIGTNGNLYELSLLYKTKKVIDTDVDKTLFYKTTTDKTDIIYQKNNGEIYYYNKNKNYQRDIDCDEPFLYPLAQKQIRVIFNGNEVELENNIQIKDGRSMYPFRDILEAMGASVIWDETNQKAIGTLNGNRVEFKIGTDEYIINGETKHMDTQSYIDSATNKTYIPIRYVAEALGFSVDWQSGDMENTITIEKGTYSGNNSNTEKDEKSQATADVATLNEDATDEDAFYADNMIVKANILRQNSMYKYLKTTTGVHKIYGSNFDKTIPTFYDTLNNYKSQMLKKTTELSNYRDFYEIALLDILTLETDDADDESKQDDEIVEMVKNIVDKEADIIESGKSIISLKNSVQKMMGVTLDDTDIDFLEYILNMKDITDEVYDTLEDMIRLRSEADSKIRILENIKKSTDNAELKAACDVLITDVENAKKAEFIAATETVVANDIIEDVTVGLYDKLISEVGKRIPVVAAASAAKKGSLLVGNLIFKTDDIASDLLKMSALCDIDSVVKEVMLESENSYTEEANYDNALSFISAADCYRAIQIYGCDVGLKFAEDVQENERNSVVSSIASPVIGLISLPTFIKRISGNAADYETIIDDINSIRNAWFYTNLYNTNNFDVAEYISISKSNAMSDWAKTYIDKAKQYEILPEYLYCNYQSNITRAEFCTLLTKLLEQATGENIETIIEQYGLQIKSEYSDVSYYYVSCMTQLGIVSGIGDGKFNPLGEITRQEAAVMLKRTADIIGIDTNANSSVSEGDSWANDGIAFVIENNVMSGVGDNFDAYGKFTKEQALTTLVRFYENFEL